MQPKPQGYGDNFTVKCGHCNGTLVNGIHGQVDSRKPVREKFRTRSEEGHGILWKMYVYVSKLLQADIVLTERASGLLAGQKASKSTGLFVGTVI